MRIDRLKRLEALLRADAKNKNGIKFDINFWGVPSNQTVTYWKQRQKINADCGTKACALGLAAISGEFKKEGLGYSHYGFSLSPEIRDGAGYVHTGFEAAEVLFDINNDQARYLFDPNCYKKVPSMGIKGELYVARRIKAFIESGGNVPDDKTLALANVRRWDIMRLVSDCQKL